RLEKILSYKLIWVALRKQMKQQRNTKQNETTKSINMSIFVTRGHNIDTEETQYCVSSARLVNQRQGIQNLFHRLLKIKESFALFINKIVIFQTANDFFHLFIGIIDHLFKRVLVVLRTRAINLRKNPTAGLQCFFYKFPHKLFAPRRGVSTRNLR